MLDYLQSGSTYTSPTRAMICRSLCRAEQGSAPSVVWISSLWLWDQAWQLAQWRWFMTGQESQRWMRRNNFDQSFSLTAAESFLLVLVDVWKWLDFIFLREAVCLLVLMVGWQFITECKLCSCRYGKPRHYTAFIKNFLSHFCLFEVIGQRLQLCWCEDNFTMRADLYVWVFYCNVLWMLCFYSLKIGKKKAANTKRHDWFWFISHDGQEFAG